MVIQLGILATAYIGIRLIEVYKRRQNTDEKAVVLSREARKALAKKSGIEASEKIYQHLFKASIVSLSIVALVPFVPALYFIGLASILYTSIPIIKLGEKQLFERRTIGHDVLYTLYIILCFATHQELFLAVGVFFYHGGSKMLAMNQAMSKPIVSKLFNEQPDTIWILKDGVEIEVPLADVLVNDIVVIRAGEAIPVDGTIIHGMAMIDQRALTGESKPVEKELNEQVFSATLVVSGQIQIKVEKAGSETSIVKIEKILDNTASYTTSIQLKGEHWANLIALPMFGLTIISIPTLGLLAATAVVHSSFGNRLRVLTPIGTLNYLHSAFAMGILIKDGRAIETLNKVDTVIFDKTGTLTDDRPMVTKVVTSHQQYTEEDILRFAATAERKLAHPLAYAIVQKAEDDGLELPPVEDSSYQLGYGVTVIIDGQTIRVGSARFMQMENIDIPKTVKTAIERSHAEGFSLVLVAVDAQVAGAIEVEAMLRPEVKTILTGLRQRGIKHISIISGDHQHPTQKLAKSLGMDSNFYNVLPEQKADIVKQLQQQGKKVCFVGDGINDAIAMKTANVSISMLGATSIATDTAQIVLMGGNLTHLCDLFDTARNLNSNLLRTLAIVVIPSAISLGGALFMGLRLAGSFLITYGGFAFALGNAMHPAFQLKVKARKEQKQRPGESA